MTKRDMAKCLILSIVTCGIYGIYWLYCLVEDVNKIDPEGAQFSAAMTIVITLVSCGIYGIYWWYTAGERLQKRNVTAESKALMYVLLQIFGLGIVNYCLLQNDINEYIDKHDTEKEVEL